MMENWTKVKDIINDFRLRISGNFREIGLLDQQNRKVTAEEILKLKNYRGARVSEIQELSKYMEKN